MIVEETDRPDFEIQLAEPLHTTPDRLCRFALQLGVNHAVTTIPEGPDDPPPWELQTLLDLWNGFHASGLDLVVIQFAPACLREPIKLGETNRAECSGRFCKQIRKMGRTGIPAMCG